MQPVDAEVACFTNRWWVRYQNTVKICLLWFRSKCSNQVTYKMWSDLVSISSKRDVYFLLQDLLHELINSLLHASQFFKCTENEMKCQCLSNPPSVIYHCQTSNVTYSLLLLASFSTVLTLLMLASDKSSWITTWYTENRVFMMPILIGVTISAYQTAHTIDI